MQREKQMMQKNYEGKWELYDENGYLKIHWDLINSDFFSWEECCFLSYIVSIYNILKDEIIENGVEYKRLANSFIKEKIDYSDNTIKKYLNKLEEMDFIKIYHRGNQKYGTRYIHLNVEYVGRYDEDPENDLNNEAIQSNQRWY